MQTHPGRPLAWLLSLFIGLSASTALRAEPAALASTPTTIMGTADRMISYRHQDHMWQTSDGVTHVLVNRGATNSGPQGLTLYTTFDNSASWSPVANLPSTDYTATSDGYIDNDHLYVTYSGKAGDILFAHLYYDSGPKKWTVLKTETVFASASTLALTPAMAVDALGRRWLSFTSQDKASSNYSIKLMQKLSDAEPWVDTGFIFGAVDNISNERSGRPIVTPKGMGMVFTVHKSSYWATRDNSWPVTAMWKRSLIYTKTYTDTDPFGSHFSVAADTNNNLHMASIDGGRVVYSRFLDAKQTWTSKVVTGDIRANYVQALQALNNVVLISNASSQLRVFQSSDWGNSFVNTHFLTHPPATGNILYDRPRVEAPTRSSSPIPVLQQFSDGIVQRAMFFAVPVVTVPKTAP
jgi:hypothetical protein